MPKFEITAHTDIQITHRNIGLVISKIFNQYHKDSVYTFKVIPRNSNKPGVVDFTHLILLKENKTVGYIKINFSVMLLTKHKALEDQTLIIKTEDPLVINLLEKNQKLNDALASRLIPQQKMALCDLPSIEHPCGTENPLLIQFMKKAYQFENPQYTESDPMAPLRADILRDVTVNNEIIMTSEDNSPSVNPLVIVALEKTFTVNEIQHLIQAYSQQLASFFKDVLSDALVSELPLIISDTGTPASPVANNHKKNITKLDDGTIYFTYSCDYLRFNNNSISKLLKFSSRNIKPTGAVNYLYGPHEVKFKLTPSKQDKDKWVFEFAEVNTPNPIMFNILMGQNLTIEDGEFVTIDPLTPKATLKQ